MERKRYHVALSAQLIDSPITAIKRLRMTLGLALREAKDQVDAMRPVGKSMLLTEDQAQVLVAEGFLIHGNTERSVSVYRKPDNSKISCIKDLRGCIGWGLKETKDVVDEMYSFNRPVDIGVINEYTVIQLRAKGFTVKGWVSEVFKDHEDMFTI